MSRGLPAAEAGRLASAAPRTGFVGTNLSVSFVDRCVLGKAMATSVRDRILETLAQLPPTATVEDAMERLYFLAKVERGLADLDAGRAVVHEDIKARYSR